MSGWITERADAYCDSVRDGTHDSPKPVERGHRLITSKHIANETLNFAGANFISDEDYEAINQRSRVDVGDLLFSMIGTVGRVYRVDDEPDYAIKNMGLFKISDELKSKYLFYYMQSPTAKQYIEGCLAGSTQKFMSLTNLRAFPIVYPNDHTTMAAIVEILDSLTWKHRINQRTNDNLFECCTAKMIDLVGTPDGAMKVSDCCESIYSGGTPSTKRPAYWNGSLPWLSSGETRSRFIIDTEKTITELGVSESSTKLAKAGDVVMASAGQGFTRGQTSMLFFDTYVNQSVVVMRPKQDYGAYLLLMLAAQYDNLRAWSDSTSTRGSMSGKLLRQFELPHFDAEQAKELMDFAAPMFAMIENNMRESKALAQARDSLLPKLMSGEIDVSKVELSTQPNNHLSV